jgi:dihydrofolate reductase
VLQASNLDSALKIAWDADVERVFVIGGAAVFAEALSHQACGNVYFTDIQKTFPCDTFLLQFMQDFEHVVENDSAMQSENGTDYLFKLYRRKVAATADTRLNLASTAP